MIFLPGTDRGLINMLNEDVELLSKELGTDIDHSFAVRKKSELPADFFIDHVKLR